MLLLVTMVCALLGASSAHAQRQPVYVTEYLHKDAGPVGPEFVAAVKRELQRSKVYEMAPSRKVPAEGILFHLHMVVACPVGDCERDGKAMAFVSIDTLGRAAWPLPDRWYDKTFVVKRGGVEAAARTVLADVAAFWCGMSHYNSAAAMAACPKELLPPWPPGFL